MPTFDRRSVRHRRSRAGLTLVELILGIAILGMVMVSLQQAITITTKSASVQGSRQNLTMQGRVAMERMVRFVEATDEIVVPASTSGVSRLQVRECWLDTYVNTTRVYSAMGDGVPDADDDANGLINDGTMLDAVDLVSYVLAEEATGRASLLEILPRYGTASFEDLETNKVIEGYVSGFVCRQERPGLVTISLVLDDGQHRVPLQTRALARGVQ